MCTYDEKLKLHKNEYPYPTEYNDVWEKETCAVRDCFWKAKQSERQKYALANPCIFGEQYIKPYIKDWDTVTAKHQYYMLYETLKDNNTIVHVPVEHAKSTWFSLVLPLWFLINDKNTYGAILSNTSTQACGFLSSIKWHIENNKRIHADFSYIKPDYKRKWAEDQIMVQRDKDKQSKDPSIVAKGTGNAILGARLEWVIADDICDLDNTATELQRDKTLKWWNEIIDSRVVDGGRKIILGTLQNQKDLLCTLSDNDVYKYINLKAYDKDTDTTLWPDKWPKKRVMDKKKTIGIISWSKVMQNDRESRETKLLDSDWLNYYGSTEKYDFNIHDKDTSVYIGIDPAIADDKDTAEKRKLDKFAIVIVGFDKISKLIYLYDYTTGYYTFPEQLRLLDKTYTKFQNLSGNVKKVGIENAAYQKALAQQATLLDSLPPVVSVKTGTASKAAKIEAFGVYSETKRFWIKRTHDEFIEEFINYEPGGKSPNVLDACIICMAMIKGFNNASDIRVYKKKKFTYNW